MMLMAGSVAVFGQGEAITKFINKYQSDETFSQVTISSKMFSLFTDLEVDDKDDQEVLDAISKLKGLRILSKEDTRDSRTLYKEALGIMPKEYEELMYVRDEDKDMKFFIKESSGKISEMVMVMGGSEEFMLLTLFGEIDLKQVSKIGSKMNVEGLEKLDNLDKDKNKVKN
ncbi:MAG: DUF4252 domain-containing protein [Flammeovirgaceae bacterium]|nr:DUF4252 domain-containing protein [Flammeovirgaceae bacterium]